MGARKLGDVSSFFDLLIISMSECSIKASTVGFQRDGVFCGQIWQDLNWLSEAMLMDH